MWMKVSAERRKMHPEAPLRDEDERECKSIINIDGQDKHDDGIKNHGAV
jgi:hypothetical protein